MGRNCVHAAWEVENGGDLLFLPPLNLFFFFFSEAPASELTFPKRQVGRQPSKAKAGGRVGGRQGKLGQPQS